MWHLFWNNNLLLFVIYFILISAHGVLQEEEGNVLHIKISIKQTKLVMH